MKNTVQQLVSWGFALAALLCESARGGNDEDDAESERLDEIATCEMEVVIRTLEQLVALRFNFVEQALLFNHLTPGGKFIFRLAFFRSGGLRGNARTDAQAS